MTTSPTRTRRNETSHFYVVPVVRELPPRPVPASAGW